MKNEVQFRTTHKVSSELRRHIILFILGIFFLVVVNNEFQIADVPFRTLRGQIVTQLPDGKFLITGGLGPNGPVAAAAIWDSRNQTLTQLPNELIEPRAWHSATVLPNGTVLILGGTSSRRQILGSAELFDPQTLTFSPEQSITTTPRSGHTATLLMDGNVFIAGGKSNNKETLNTSELWESKNRTLRSLPASLFTARHRHTASLNADGNVVLYGGVSRNGTILHDAEVYAPAEEKFTITQTTTRLFNGPKLEASFPLDRATNVRPDTIISLRFSEPLVVESVSTQSVKLLGPLGQVAITVIPAEAGIIAFVTPEKPLVTGRYILSLNGLKNRSDVALDSSEISFTTADEQIVLDNSTSGEEDWMPQNGMVDKTWRTGRPPSVWQSLPPLKAGKRVTALSGQVLKLNGQPLQNVTLQIGRRKTVTDHTGRFLLINLRSGWREMIIDGRPANSKGKTYGIFEVGVNILPRKTNILPYTIWMTKIDTAHAIKIPSPTTSEVVVTTPSIPGLEVRLPPNALIRDHEGKIVNEVSITPIPLDRPPFPLAQGVEVPLFFTIQPGGAYIEASQGARVIYPNYRQELPSEIFYFWHYDPENKYDGWYIYGLGRVSKDGAQIIPEDGVSIYEFTGAMVTCLGAPLEGPTPGGCGPGQHCNKGLLLAPPTSSCGLAGDPVDCSTGLFLHRAVDLYLPDVLPLQLIRTYRTKDEFIRSFGVGAAHPYNLFLTIDTSNYSYAEMILSDGARVRLNRISPGTGFTDAVMEHTATPTVFYKAVMTWNGKGWDVKLKDGTVYVFGDSASFQLQSIRDRYGNQIIITRSNGQNGQITRITSPNGKWMTFTYDIYNEITQVRDNAGRTVNYVYSGSTGRLTKVTDANGGITDYTWSGGSPYWQMATIKDPRGIIRLTNEYDVNGRVFRQTLANGTTYQFVYTLNGSGKVIQTDVTDPRGNIRRMTFNSSGYILTDKNAVGTPIQQTTTYERQAGTNLVLSVTDPLGRITTFTYDGMGNVVTVTRLSGTPQASTSTFAYEATFNQLASITDPLNHITSFIYDAKGNPIALTNPLGNPTNLTYNASGQILSITNALGHTTQFGYGQGDLNTVTSPLGNHITQFVDSVGRLVSRTNPVGQTVRYERDAGSRLTKITDPLAGVTSFAYDANDNLISVTDARNKITSYTYNNMNRLTSRIDPLLLSESYLYDASGSLQQVTDRKVQVTNYTYDALNRPAQVGYADGSTTTFTFDAGNRLTQLVDSISGTITLSYDNLDRLISETTPHGSISYTYDAANRRTSMTVAGQPAVNYTYDNANRLTQITQGTSTVAISYDTADRRTSLTLPNSIIMQYSYDNASQLTGITYRLGAAVLGDLIYEYDAAGRRIKITGSFARTSLPASVSSATYNAANRQLTFGSLNLTYDNNGNLTNDGINNYTWNSRDELISINGPGLTGSFQYDAFGRRIAKTTGGASTNYLYDGFNPVQELSGGAPTANLLTSLGMDEYFTRGDSAGTRGLLMDALGSTIALADSAGAVQTQYTFEPFGRTTATGAGSMNSFQFTSRENDGTGLYYYRARYYHPTLQRFIGEDMLEFAGGEFNQYSYVSNNPVSFIDPKGLAKSDKTFGLPRAFWKWYHRQIKEKGDPDLERNDAEEWYRRWQEMGEPDAEGHATKDPSNSEFSVPKKGVCVPAGILLGGIVGGTFGFIGGCGGGLATGPGVVVACPAGTMGGAAAGGAIGGAIAMCLCE